MVDPHSIFEKIEFNKNLEEGEGVSASSTPWLLQACIPITQSHPIWLDNAEVMSHVLVELTLIMLELYFVEIYLLVTVYKKTNFLNVILHIYICCN